jgi:membrane fusion protein (multidrug efflux system)
MPIRSSLPPRPGRRRLASSLTLLSLAAVLTLSGCERQAQPAVGAQIVQVGVLTLVAQHIIRSTELSGRLSALEVSDVRPQVDGIVQKRLFTEGSDVNAGEVLYQIDPASYQAASDEARGTLEKARATLASAQTKAVRYVDLVKINAVSKQDYDDAEAAVREDMADVVADEASLESARVNLNRTRIVAPISGRIGSSSVTPGALVSNGQSSALATIQAFDRMYLDVTRSSTEWLALQKALASGRIRQTDGSAIVTLQLEDGTTYAHPGTLQFAGITVDATTGSITLRAIFPNPERTLLPGMFVRARLDEGDTDHAILVPQAAVARASDGSASVYVADASATAREVKVTADEAYGDQWIVTAGLKPGDRVIVSGLQQVHADAPVQIAAQTTQPAVSEPALLAQR